MAEELGADTPTDGLEAQAPAESETSNVAVTDEAQPTETVEDNPDQAEDEKSGAGEDEEKPKRRSGYERMKRRALMAEAELANERLKALNTRSEAKSDDKAPKEEDFNGDWTAFIAAKAAHEASLAVRETLHADKAEQVQSRADELKRQVVSDFEERCEAFKEKATDFDQVLDRFVSNKGTFSEHLRDLIVDSDKGPELTYFLAKNPAKAAELNALTPVRAAKEIGALEEKLSRPQSKPTQAKPPINPVKGGSSAPSQEAALEAWMTKTYGKHR